MINKIMIKACNFCGGTDLIKKQVQYIYHRKGKLLVVNNVPCEECGNCGERYYSASVLKKIEDEFEAIGRGEKIVHNEILVPVEEFAEFAS
jgi:YgiT-type zinc finger domain-containing protein